MIPRAGPETLPYIRPKVERFLEFCRNRAAEHKRPEPAIEPPQRQFVPQSQPAYRKGDQTPIVIAWLKAQTEPQLIEQIVAGTGVNDSTVRYMLRRRPDLFEEVGRIPKGKTFLKLWRVR